MSVKYNESLSKKLNYHQKSAHSKSSVNSVTSYSKSLGISTPGLTKTPSIKKDQTEGNYDDDSIKNTVQSIKEKKDTINTITNNANELNNSSEEKKRKDSSLNQDINQKLSEETKKAVEKMEVLLNLLQNQTIRTSPNTKRTNKANDIKILKEENDALLSNINSMKLEHDQITEKYSKLKSKYNNASQRPQTTSENTKYQELVETNNILQRENKALEKKLKYLVGVLNNELEEKNKLSKSLAKVASRKNLQEDKSLYLMGNSLKKNQALESIEKEIMINKLNSLQKEIMLKDKEIAMLTQSLSEVGLNEMDSDDDLRFEESYNVTNVSDHTLNNDLNNNLAEDNISGSDIDNRTSDYKANIQGKAAFDISLKRFEKNKQIKHLSENIIEDEQKDSKKNIKSTKTSNLNTSKQGIKPSLKSSGKEIVNKDTYRKYLK